MLLCNPPTYTLEFCVLNEPKETSMLPSSGFVGVFVIMFITPPSAPEPYKTPSGPFVTSTLSMLPASIECETPHPNNDINSGLPSINTIILLQLSPKPLMEGSVLPVSPVF